MDGDEDDHITSLNALVDFLQTTSRKYPDQLHVHAVNSPEDHTIDSSVAEDILRSALSTVVSYPIEKQRTVHTLFRKLVTTMDVHKHTNVADITLAIFEEQLNVWSQGNTWTFSSDAKQINQLTASPVHTYALQVCIRLINFCCVSGFRYPPHFFSKAHMSFRKGQSIA